MANQKKRKSVVIDYKLKFSCRKCGTRIIIIIVLVLFLIGWSFAGAGWLIRAMLAVQFTKSTELNYCDPTLYIASYGIISFVIIYVLGCFCTCIIAG